MRRLVCSLGEMGGAASSICYLPSIRPLETAQFYLEHLLKRKFATSRPIDEGRTGKWNRSQTHRPASDRPRRGSRTAERDSTATVVYSYTNNLSS